MLKHLQDNWPRYRFGQPAHVTAGVVVLFGLYYLVQPVVSTKLLQFVHLACFSTYFGMQFWVTFVAGLTMFHNLPRYWFSAVQSKLFPRYFLSGTLFSVITFVTFLSAHPFGSHDNMQTKIQVYSLIGVIVCTISNVFVTPVMIGYLNDRNKIEMKKGIDKDHIGHIDSSKFAGDLKYKDLSKKFLLYHGISSLLNLLAFCANVVYLYILSAGLTI